MRNPSVSPGGIWRFLWAVHATHVLLAACCILLAYASKAPAFLGAVGRWIGQGIFEEAAKYPDTHVTVLGNWSFLGVYCAAIALCGLLSCCVLISRTYLLPRLYFRVAPDLGRYSKATEKDLLSSFETSLVSSSRHGFGCQLDGIEQRVGNVAVMLIWAVHRVGCRAFLLLVGATHGFGVGFALLALHGVSAAVRACISRGICAILILEGLQVPLALLAQTLPHLPAVRCLFSGLLAGMCVCGLGVLQNLPGNPRVFEELNAWRTLASGPDAAALAVRRVALIHTMEAREVLLLCRRDQGLCALQKEILGLMDAPLESPVDWLQNATDPEAATWMHAMRYGAYRVTRSKPHAKNTPKAAASATVGQKQQVNQVKAENARLLEYQPPDLAALLREGHISVSHLFGTHPEQRSALSRAYRIRGEELVRPRFDANDANSQYPSAFFFPFEMRASLKRGRTRQRRLFKYNDGHHHSEQDAMRRTMPLFQSPSFLSNQRQSPPAPSAKPITTGILPSNGDGELGLAGTLLVDCELESPQQTQGWAQQHDDGGWSVPYHSNLENGPARPTSIGVSCGAGRESDVQFLMALIRAGGTPLWYFPPFKRTFFGVLRLEELEALFRAPHPEFVTSATAKRDAWEFQIGVQGRT